MENISGLTDQSTEDFGSAIEWQVWACRSYLYLMNKLLHLRDEWYEEKVWFRNILYITFQWFWSLMSGSICYSVIFFFFNYFYFPSFLISYHLASFLFFILCTYVCNLLSHFFLLFSVFFLYFLRFFSSFQGFGDKIVKLPISPADKINMLFLG